jgi:anti-sigma B factor antagonist
VIRIEHGPAGTVAVAGRLDAAAAPQAQAFLDGVEGVVTLDLAALEYISSAGLGVLLKTQKRLMGGGGRLKLARLRPALKDIFVYAGFDQLFEIEIAQGSDPGVRV